MDASWRQNAIAANRQGQDGHTPVRDKWDKPRKDLGIADVTECEFCRTSRSRRSSPSLTGKNGPPTLRGTSGTPPDGTAPVHH